MLKKLCTAVAAATVLALAATASLAQETVTRDNFARAETDRMFRDISMLAGGVNQFHHITEPTPLDQQTVIRMNLDTLYSGAVIDARAGATITVPELPEGRYASVLIIDNDHYAPAVFYDAGVHEIPHDTDFMFAAVRIQVFNPNDPKEIALVNDLQQQFTIQAGSAEPLPPFNWDKTSLDALRADMEEASRGLPNFEGAMGPRGQVDPDKHLIATAAAWGLFPEQHATYFNDSPGLGTDRCYQATYSVPKNKAFWSITMYGATGFIEYPNAIVNSSNAVMNDDGTFTVHFGSKALCGDVPNRLDTPEGWNIMMRVYRPDASVLGGGYVLPEVVAIP